MWFVLSRHQKSKRPVSARPCLGYQRAAWPRFVPIVGVRLKRTQRRTTSCVPGPRIVENAALPMWPANRGRRQGGFRDQGRPGRAIACRFTRLLPLPLYFIPYISVPPYIGTPLEYSPTHASGPAPVRSLLISAPPPEKPLAASTATWSSNHGPRNIYGSRKRATSLRRRPIFPSTPLAAFGSNCSSPIFASHCGGHPRRARVNEDYAGLSFRGSTNQPSLDLHPALAKQRVVFVRGQDFEESRNCPVLFLA